MTTSEKKKRNCHLSIPISLVDLTVFQLKFYTFFKTKYQTILQLLVTYRSLQKFSCYSEVLPIHENNFLLEMSNCRPIFLLFNVNKIFEKLMHSRISWGKKKSLLQTVWVQKRFLNTLCHFNFARKHTKSTWWRTFWMQDYHRHHKSIWHRKSWQTTWKTKSLWYKSISNYLFRSSLSNRTQFSSINGFKSD